jgi:hypothetical protein
VAPADEPGIEASVLASFSKGVLEASFTRVNRHTGNRNAEMILASRDDLTSKENRRRHAALKSNARKAGYGFIEGGRVDETSLLVVGKKGRGWWGSARISEIPWGKVRSRFDSL